MDVWILVLTFTVRLLDVDVIVQHGQWIFATQAVCEEVRPVLTQKADTLAPHGFQTSLTAKVTSCMPQRVLSSAEALEYLDAHPHPEGRTP